MKIVILYSGGLDSVIMHHLAKKEYPNSNILLRYYNIGQEYAEKEMKNLPQETLIRNIDWIRGSDDIQQKENTHNIMIPGRNLVLATLVACQELPDQIWLGALQGEIHDKATDKNYTFLDLINTTINYVISPYTEKDILVRFPLADKGFGKFESVKYYLDTGGSPETLLKSSSCLSAEKNEDTNNCGHCIVCLRRWGIFSQLGLKEKYVHHPVYEMSNDNKKMILEMLKGEINQPSHYDEFRRREIMPALYNELKTNAEGIKEWLLRN